MTLAERVAAAWYAPRLTALAALLWPLSVVFRAVVATRRTLFRAGVLRSTRLPVPVIVIGNLNVGGAGKTPLTCALAAELHARGFHPGIVSRGYGGSAREPRAASRADDPRIVGDEPLILAATGFPVWIGRDRVAAARGLLAAHPACDVLLCDDGLQHYRLARDVEIAVIDAEYGFGNGMLLPAGPLREPPGRLAEVDAVVRLVARDAPRRPARDARETLMTYEPLPWRNLVDATRVADVASWRGRDVHALAGIAHPQRFFALLRSMGIAAFEHPLPDHHAFTAADLAYPATAAILMTQKDAVKCVGLADVRCWYLPLSAVLDPALPAYVENRIRGFQTA
ncbi:MAG: tetraacyldisaccharide 4'-kinase [Burkholderiales bacterium]|nr:tetraacyldisaccharide 4'-kinase [Burkholderiales bacterium]